MAAMPDHLGMLPRALRAEWAASTEGRPTIIAEHFPRSSFNVHQLVGQDGGVAYQWAVTPMYGCLVVGISAEVKVREDLRKHGVATYMRGLRTRAMRRAGFRAEICTVRTDNEGMTKIMQRSGAQIIGTFPSDKGGEINMWRTELPTWEGDALPDISQEQAHQNGVPPGGAPSTHWFNTRTGNDPWTVISRSVTCPACRDDLADGAGDRTFWQFQRQTARVPDTRDLLWVEAPTVTVAETRAREAFPAEWRAGHYRTNPGVLVSHVAGPLEAVIILPADGRVIDIPARRTRY